MTGRPPLPWWKRKQPTLIAEAARRAGLTATARLEGWLEIRDAAGTIIEAQFNQDSGALKIARGWSNTDPREPRRFEPRADKGITPRMTTDEVVEWIRSGRPIDEIRAARRREREANRRKIGEPNYVPAGIAEALEDDAIVSDFTTRKRRR